MKKVFSSVLRNRSSSPGPLEVPGREPKPVWGFGGFFFWPLFLFFLFRAVGGWVGVLWGLGFFIFVFLWFGFFLSFFYVFFIFR